MADVFTAEQIKQITDAMNAALADQQKETDDEARARILAIKDPFERQRAISDNIDLFKERIH